MERERDPYQDNVERRMDEEANRTSVAENASGLTEDPDVQPGRGAVSRRTGEPGPTDNVGLSDYPPGGKDPSS